MRSIVAPALLLLGLGGCSLRAADVSDPVPTTGVVRITNVDVDSTGADVLVRARVENGTTSPVFAITSPRRTVYRPESNSLELTLVEEPMLPGGTSADCHYMQPSQRQLGSLSAETIELHLPRVQKQLITASPSKVVDAPLYESKEVSVALAWSNVPLVPDKAVVSKCRLEMSQNVAAKQLGVTNGYALYERRPSAACGPSASSVA